MVEIDKHAADVVNKLLIGNKCDLALRKVVSTGGAEELANSLNNRLLEASATSAHNVEENLYTMAGMIKQRIVSQQVRSGGGRWREVVEYLRPAPAVSYAGFAHYGVHRAVTSGALRCTCAVWRAPLANTNTNRGRRACTSLGRVGEWDESEEEKCR